MHSVDDFQTQLAKARYVADELYDMLEGLDKAHDQEIGVYEDSVLDLQEEVKEQREIIKEQLSAINELADEVEYLRGIIADLAGSK